MEKELQKLGLHEHESRVYLAALSLGPSSAAQLAENTKIKRPTVYLALDNLMNQGLVHRSPGAKTLFVAEDPKKLEKLTQRMRRQVIDAEILLENILPGLVNFPKQHNEEPKVSFYPGTEGLKNVALEISSCPSAWYAFGSSAKLIEKLIKSKRMDILHDSWNLRSKPDRSKIYIITDAGVFALGKEWKQTSTPWREMKILPNIVHVGSGFIIYEDKLAILNLENKPFAAVIKSKEVVEVVKLMYQLIWKSLPEEKPGKGG